MTREARAPLQSRQVAGAWSRLKSTYQRERSIPVEDLKIGEADSSSVQYFVFDQAEQVPRSPQQEPGAGGQDQPTPFLG